MYEAKKTPNPKSPQNYLKGAPGIASQDLRNVSPNSKIPFLQNYCYVAFGVLSVLAAFASTALISEKFIPQIKLLSDLDNNTAYVETQKARDE